MAISRQTRRIKETSQIEIRQQPASWLAADPHATPAPSVERRHGPNLAMAAIASLGQMTKGTAAKTDNLIISLSRGCAHPCCRH
jgi:hypothetical protein